MPSSPPTPASRCPTLYGIYHHLHPLPVPVNQPLLHSIPNLAIPPILLLFLLTLVFVDHIPIFGAEVLDALGVGGGHSQDRSIEKLGH